MSSLAVLLPLATATAQTEFAYAMTPDGRTAGIHATALAALLPQPTGAGAEVIAIAPAAAISWHKVDLPRGTHAGSPRLRAVLEGLLEDRLLDEPDSVHFALQPAARPGEPTWVAVCDRAWLRAAVSVLEAAQRPATRIVPEFTPQADLALYAVGEANDAHVVACGPNGVMSVPLTPAALPLLPLMEADAPHIAEPAVAALAEQILQRKFALQQAATRWLAAAQSGWDLAQMEFASSGRARTFKKIAGGWAGILRAPQWRPLRSAAVLLVALNLIGLNAWAWKERSSLDAKRQAINRALTQTFPNVKVVVDAPIQMEKEVAALRQAAGASSSRDLETMLGALAVDAPAEPLASIDYSSGSLRARFAPPPSGQARVASTLKAAGFDAVWQVDTLVVTPQAAP